MRLTGIIKQASLLSALIFAGSIGFPASAQQVTQQAEDVSRTLQSGTATSGAMHADVELKAGDGDAGLPPGSVPQNVPAYRYEKNSSDVVHYDLPDASVKPLELRMQDMERRISEMETRMSEVEDHLRDVILAVNRIVREGAR